MKKFLSILALIFTALTAYGQAEKSIVIDQKTFRPVQSDMLTGYAVDEIVVDSSRRPCARIKVKINRMTRAEIDQIEVKIATNNQLTKCRTADYETGLILEMTAKPQSRFYFVHPEFGESNEVLLNLEPNKEYYIEAYLNQSFSIVVNSNVAGANVYLDNIHKGRTDSNFSLTIAEVMIGDHTLRVEYGNGKFEQQITVNKSNIFFRQNVNVEASKPQFVVFVVEPKSAVVIIDGKLYTPQDGVVTTVLESGSYNYSISAKNYHEAKGTFSVAGAKVEKSIALDPAYGWLEVKGSQLEGAAVFVDDEFIGTAPVKSGALSSGKHTVKIVKELYDAHTAVVTISDNKITTYNPTLSADFANVTINAVEGVEIWINGEKKGTKVWKGRLATGAYIFEARKAGHKTTTLTKSISATPAYQVYNLETPTAITGGVVVTSNPAMADVAVDGKLVGRTPISLDNLIVGQHTITISKEGYSKHTEQITVSQSKGVNLDITLHKGTKGPYKVGDFYDVEGVKGVVTSVNGAGYTGTIALLPQSATRADVKQYKVGDIITIDGVKGVVFEVDATGFSGKAVSMTQSKSQLRWTNRTATEIQEKGLDNSNDGSENAKTLRSFTSYPAFDWCQKLGKSWYLPAKDELVAIYKNKIAIDKRLKTKLGNNAYWSSTEKSQFYAHTVGMKSGNVYSNYKNNSSYYVRAVAKFSEIVEGRHFTAYPTTKGPYKVGDFYNEKGLQGVVFNVDRSGKFGQIVHLEDDVKETGWHYASTYELESFALKNADAINKTLEIYGTSTANKRYIPTDMKVEWRSTNSIGDRDSYRYIYHYIYNNRRTTRASRERTTINGSARAVRSFGGGETKAPYAVGDYYNENGKEGIVFEVSADGMHGKIVWGVTIASWQHKGTKPVLIGAMDSEDGINNTQKIKSLPNWRKTYGVFVACATLGEDWYLPSLEEVKRINANRHIINATFDAVTRYGSIKSMDDRKLRDWECSTSTEVNKKKVWAIDADNKTAQWPKITKKPHSIFPVAKF